MRRLSWSALALLAAASAAEAQQGGHAYGAATLRAGPSHGYPQVATLARGDGLTVQGCVANWSWCDVRWQEQRGWMPAAMIEFDARDDGRTVASAMPVVAFSLDDYWNAHYRDRPWSRQRARWRQLPAPQETPLPGPLTRQLTPPQQAAPSASAAQPSTAWQPPAWVPPNERMERQLPPPDAVNPKRHPEWHPDPQENTARPANRWPLNPEEVKRIEEEARRKKEQESKGQTP